MVDPAFFIGDTPSNVSIFRGSSSISSYPHWINTQCFGKKLSHLMIPHLTPIYIHVKCTESSESTVAYRVPNCSIFKNQGALLATPRMISDPSAAISKSELPTWRCWVVKWDQSTQPLCSNGTLLQVVFVFFWVGLGGTGYHRLLTGYLEH